VENREGRGNRKDRINMEGTEVMERGKGLIFKV
jgi:hypothetical protein